MRELDIEFVRSQFPAFKTPELKKKSFFENAGGSYMAGAVIDRLNRFYISRKVQPYAGYEASYLAGEEMDESRSRLAALLGVKTDTLHFGPSTSQNTYVLAQAFRKMKNNRRTLIVTNQDHEANSGVWRRLENEGFELREWCIDKSTGSLNLRDLETLLDERVLLVAFPHCSNILGEINDAAAICEKINSYGAYSCVDGVSFVPHGFPNITDIGADIYLFSSYKTYGPHLGIMYISRNLNFLLENQGHFFNSSFSGKRLTPAGPDHAQIASSAGMVDYCESLYYHHFKERSELSRIAEKLSEMQRLHETKLLEPLLDFLKTKPNVSLLGPKTVERRVPTVSLELGSRAPDVARKLDDLGIMTDSGDFYAVRLLDELGVDLKYGVLRFSFVHYTSAQEIEHLIKSLDNIL